MSDGAFDIAESTPPKTTQIRCLSDLVDFLDAWRALAGGSPMQSPEWFISWWQFYAERDDELSVLLFHEPGGLLIGLQTEYFTSNRCEGRAKAV